MPELQLATLMATRLPPVPIVDMSHRLYYNVRASAISTAIQAPIRTLNHSPPEALPPIPTRLYCEPNVDPTAVFQTEADVSRSLATHLVYPVNHGLNAPVS